MRSGFIENVDFVKMHRFLVFLPFFTTYLLAIQSSESERVINEDIMNGRERE